MTSETVTSFDIADGVGLLTLRRPSSRNAVNAQLSLEVGTALEQANASPDVRAVVITGEGDCFCAGADLKALAEGRELTAPGHPEWGFGGIVEHVVSVPIIAALNGHAMGGGAEIVLASDLAVMADDALIGLPEVKRGLFAAAGGAIRLPRQVPPKIALQIGLLGEPVTASEALRWGLVNDVVPRESVVDRAIGFARQIAANAPLAVAVTKSMMHAATGGGSSWDLALWKRQDAEMGRLLSSADAHEGATAFLEKRDPIWSGT